MRRLGKKVLDWLRSAPEPTLGGRLVLTFVVLSTIFAWLLRNNQVIFVTTTILATVVVSFLITSVSASRLSVRRHLPQRVFAGAPFDVRLRVRNESRWRPALGLGFLDALQVSEPGGITRGPTVPVLPPRRTVEVAYVKRIHRRGIYTVVNTLAATRFPFGIFERRLLTQSPARLVVLPSLGRLRRAGQRDLDRRAAQPEAVRHAREGNEEFHSLREYRPGDNPRHIHWRTSARAGKLMRRVMREEATEDVTVLLDTCVDGLDAQLRQRHFEKAVSCAATLIAHAAARGRRARLYFPGGSVSHKGTRMGLLPALEALAGVEAGRVPAARLVSGAPVGRRETALLLSLGGKAAAARRAAAARGIRLRVWDVSDDRFGRYFVRR
ncbi:MAG: DUF58 domain-containing protein [Planctomycetota bacterium]|jgi:uncharacterized protein (DUF58 family)